MSEWNPEFFLSSGRAPNFKTVLIAEIHWVFWGLNFASNTGIEMFKGKNSSFTNSDIELLEKIDELFIQNKYKVICIFGIDLIA